jgi:hypothetical protein
MKPRSSSIQETKKKPSLSKTTRASKQCHKKASRVLICNHPISFTLQVVLIGLATSDITGVLALGVVGLAEEVVDPLEEVLEREALGESLAGLAVGLVA